MTRKRFKKLLMGKYKYSRNEAENLSRWDNRSIKEKPEGTIINDTIWIISGDYWKFTPTENSKLIWDSFSNLVTDALDRRKSNVRGRY